MYENIITSKVIQAAHSVYSILGSNLFEICYEKAMCIELKRHNFIIERQKPLPVFYKGHLIGDFYCDLCLENLVITELKACSYITKKHQAQLLHYMKVANVKVGLIRNFSPEELQVKRMVL